MIEKEKNVILINDVISQLINVNNNPKKGLVQNKNNVFNGLSKNLIPVEVVMEIKLNV